MKITFLGAAGEVTGSQHLIETHNLRVLLDCGLFQGRRGESRAKNEKIRCDPANLDGAILSHAHIDHCGNLPRLYTLGFRGPVFCTTATADVAEIMLNDSVRIQEEDAKYLSTHLKPGHPPIEPLYSRKDVERIVRLMLPLDYDEWHELAPDFRLRFSDSGHILGSAITEMEIIERAETRRVVFTGDLGRRDLPILRDPQPVAGCDILITESTYGNRIHPSPADLKTELLRIVREAVAVDGKVIIPAFSLGRTQNVVYFLNELHNEGLLPAIPVFVDSPLARRLTSVYRDHKNIMDDDVQRTLETDSDPFGFPGLEYVLSRKDSMQLNHRAGPFIVVSASGMCESGRVVHHLKNSVSDIRNTVVIIGFQAAHTLGRRIVERQPELRIFDRKIPLRAKVEKLNGLSAHADVEDFKWWFEQMASQTGIGQAFIVHGESNSAQSLAGILRDYCDEEPVVPELYQMFEV